MDATAWALIIALHIHPQPSDPSWLRDADGVWLKFGVGGFASERYCQYILQQGLRDMEKFKMPPHFEFKSAHCEPYTRADKISAP